MQRHRQGALEALYGLLEQAHSRRDKVAISGITKKIDEVIVLIKGSD